MGEDCPNWLAREIMTSAGFRRAKLGFNGCGGGGCGGSGGCGCGGGKAGA